MSSVSTGCERAESVADQITHGNDTRERQAEGLEGTATSETTGRRSGVDNSKDSHMVASANSRTTENPLRRCAALW